MKYQMQHSHADSAEHMDLSSIKHCLQEGDTKLALQYCHELLVNNPQHLQLLSFAAIASRSLGWLDNALEFINRAVAVAPNQPALYCLLGDILLLLKRPGDALGELLKAQHLGDNSAQLNFNIGCSYLSLANYADAKIYFDRALALDHQMTAAHVNKGLAEHSLMNLDAALDCFDAALCIDPSNLDAQWNKSHILLTLGKYEQGFRLYETRWRHPKVTLKRRYFDSKLWLGHENLSGKTILLYAEGGFGDTIQFVRYAKLFEPDVALFIQCQAPLISLVKGMGLDAEVISSGDMPPPHDFHCPLMSLPLAFGTTIETIPRFDRYIFASNEHVEKWDPFLNGLTGPKIGIVARGSNSFSNNKNRSFDLKELVTQLPKNASHVVLQKELSKNECEFIDSCDNIVAPGKALETFSDTAAICVNLDHVISVDTAVAHLSAALGTPTSILVAYRPDWRWGATGETTEWYPNVRLIRQTQWQGWKSALNKWHIDCLQQRT